MLPVMLICIILDRDADKILPLLAWILIAVMALADRHRSWTRLSAAVTATATVIIISGIIAFLAGDFRESVSSFFKYQIAVLWLAITWLALPIFPRPSHAGTSARIPSRRFFRSPLPSLITLLLAFTAWATFSAAGSLFPEESMDLLGSELLPYTGIFILLIRLTCQSPLPDAPPPQLSTVHSQLSTPNAPQLSTLNSQLSTPPAPQLSTLNSQLSTHRASWLIIVTASLAMAIIALLALASPGLQKLFLNADLFRLDSDAPDTHRLQFLFHHHNRAGFFAACAIFLSLAGAFGRTHWRALGICGAIAAAIALPFTLTRGALIAAAAGMTAFTLLGLTSYRRGRWALLTAFVLSIPLIWALLPENYQDHIAKITNLRNYREGQGGSIGARLIMWENAADMIEKRPALGFGYGFENFVATARHDNPHIPNYFQDAVHAHNQWLETAAETGIPGLLLLAAFTSLRILWLLATWWTTSRRKHPLAWLLLLWLSLEITIQVYGLTNYTLRRNLGYLTYAIWSGSVVLILLIQYTKPPPQQPST